MTRILFLLVAATAAVVAVAIALPNGGLAHAAEIKVLSTTGVKGAISELARRFEGVTGHKIVVDFDATAVLARRIDAGEAFDVAVLGRTQMAELVRKGRITEDTHVMFGRTGMRPCGSEGWAEARYKFP